MSVDKRMDLWHKMRRAWTLVSTRIKLRKSGGSGGRGGVPGGDYGGDVGLLKLRDDVQMCGYRDVEVMWNMLRAEQLEVARRANAKAPKRSTKQRLVWRLVFWTNHNP